MFGPSTVKIVQTFVLLLPMSSFICVKLLCLFTLAVSGIHGHSQFPKPPARDTWNYNYCGSNYDQKPYNNITNNVVWHSIYQSKDPGTNCGVCGDWVHATIPRAHEYNGTYGKDGPYTAYRQGQVILIQTVMQNPHGGKINWRLHPNTETSNDDQATFDQYLLNVTSLIEQTPSDQFTKLAGGNTVYIMTYDRPNAPVDFTAVVPLPYGVGSDLAVIQMNYRAGSIFTDYASFAAAEAGIARQTFRACSDIRIAPIDEPQQRLQSVVFGTCIQFNYDNNYSFRFTPCDAGNANQTFLTTIPWNATDDAPFRIVVNPQYDGRCMDVYGQQKYVGNEIGGWDCNGGLWQQWTKLPVVNSTTFLLKGSYSGLCIRANPGRTKTTQAVCNPSDGYQRWRIIIGTTMPPPLPPVILRNQQFGLCLTPTTAGYSFTLTTCADSGSLSQVVTTTVLWWSLQWASSTIIFSNNKCTDVFQQSSSPGYEVGQWVCNGQNNQQYKISLVNRSEGSFLISTYGNGVLCIQAYQKSPTSSLYTRQQTCSPDDHSQLWTVFVQQAV